jgi:hypothetical protein
MAVVKSLADYSYPFVCCGLEHESHPAGGVATLPFAFDKPERFFRSIPPSVMYQDYSGRRRPVNLLPQFASISPLAYLVGPFLIHSVTRSSWIDAQFACCDPAAVSRKREPLTVVQKSQEFL